MEEIIPVFFQGAWEFFQIKWPGFDFTIGAVFIGVALAVIGLKVIGTMLGISISASLAGSFFHAFRRPTLDGGGNNPNLRISEGRKNDRR